LRIRNKNIKDITMKNLRLISFFTLLSCFALVNSQDCKNKVVIGERLKVYSTVYGKERKITVGLPYGYDSNKKYPVLYMLDGLAQFSIGSVYTRTSYQGVLPRMIVVAIDYENRTNEYTPTHVEEHKDSGGSAKFVEFIEKDLVPYIDSAYSTMPYRVISGHSFAGILVVDLFLSKPMLFNSYIALDPSIGWDNNYELNKLVNHNKNEDLNHKSIYISVIPENKPPVVAFDSVLNVKQAPGLRHTYQVFEDEGHASSVYPSIYYGLRYIFSDYSVTDAQRKHEFDKIPEFIKNHYSNFSKQVGVEFLPPEHVYISSARMALYGNENKDVQAAIMILKSLKRYYPESDRIFECLGEAYLISGDSKSALNNYKKALEFNPNNKEAKKKISELEK
jgi:predicted alpha/beta superfamily hydrolase